MTKSLPIGIFDSGVGGITVLKALQALMPEENFVYFADTARLPYGDKTPDQIKLYFQDIAQWMQGYGIKALAVACNTSSAIALEEILFPYPFPIIGTIEPTAMTLGSMKQRVGVIATSATVRSNTYEKAIRRHNPEADVYSMACPALVPLIEANHLTGPQVAAQVAQYLTPLVDSSIDKLIYGCTHYPYLSQVIEDFLPGHIKIVDPALAMAKEIQRILKAENLENKSPAHSPYFYTTGNLDSFSASLEVFYGKPALVQHAHIKVAA